jgi:flagellar basal-body rod protein FlgB
MDHGWRPAEEILRMALIDTVEHLHGALDYHLARHNLLSSNLAHIETPGYKPVDLARSFKGEMHTALSATHPGHIATSKTGGANTRVVADPGAASGTDGNGVDIDREAVKIATNQMRYDMLAQLASSELASLAWAANDGKHG